MAHANAPLSELGRLEPARFYVEFGSTIRGTAERFQVSTTTVIPRCPHSILVDARFASGTRVATPRASLSTEVTRSTRPPPSCATRPSRPPTATTPEPRTSGARTLRARAFASTSL